MPNARVREFAKEVVEVMFNSAPVQNNSTNTLAAQVSAYRAHHARTDHAATVGWTPWGPGSSSSDDDKSAIADFGKQTPP